MPSLYELIPDVDVFLALEPEEVAGLVMELITNTTQDEGPRLNPRVIANSNVIGDYPMEKKQQIANILMEGWQWLLREGFIAPRPDDSFGWHFVTRRGSKVKGREDLAAYLNSVFLRRDMLHPRIMNTCWSCYIRGEYDTAVFKTFRELEIIVREKGGFEEEDYGVELARKAFRTDDGILTDLKAPAAERESMAHLMAGAIGLYKNPHSHRSVKLGAAETAEMIMLGSHLAGIIDTIVPNEP